jgi:hypothetical protein
MKSELRYLYIVIPILLFGWIATIRSANNGDFVTLFDFIVVAAILTFATVWVVFDIVRKK